MDVMAVVGHVSEQVFDNHYNSQKYVYDACAKLHTHTRVNLGLTLGGQKFWFSFRHYFSGMI